MGNAMLKEPGDGQHTGIDDSRDVHSMGSVDSRVTFLSNHVSDPTIGAVPWSCLFSFHHFGDLTIATILRSVNHDSVEHDVVP